VRITGHAPLSALGDTFNFAGLKSAIDNALAIGTPEGRMKAEEAAAKKKLDEAKAAAAKIEAQIGAVPFEYSGAVTLAQQQLDQVKVKNHKILAQAQRDKTQASIDKYRSYLASGQYAIDAAKQNIDIAKKVYECSKSPLTANACVAEIASKATGLALTAIAPIVGRLQGEEVGPLAASIVQQCYKMGFNIPECAKEAARQGIIWGSEKLPKQVSLDYINAVDACISQNKAEDWEECAGDTAFAIGTHAAAMYGVPPAAIVAARSCAATKTPDACAKSAVIAGATIACMAAGTAATSGSGAVVVTPICGFLAGPIGSYIYSELGLIFNNWYRPDKVILDFLGDVGTGVTGIVTRIVHAFGGGEGCGVYDRVWAESVDTYIWPKLKQTVQDVALAVESLRAQMLLPPNNWTYEQYANIVFQYASNNGFYWKLLEQRPIYDTNAVNAMTDWSCSPDTQLLNDRADYMLKIRAVPAVNMYMKGAADAYQAIALNVALEFRANVENKAAALIAQSKDPAFIAEQQKAQLVADMAESSAAIRKQKNAFNAARVKAEAARVEAWRAEEAQIRDAFSKALSDRIAENKALVAESQAQTDQRVSKALMKQKTAKTFAIASAVAAVAMLGLAVWAESD